MLRRRVWRSGRGLWICPAQFVGILMFMVVSLTSRADCSGFVMSVFAEFGYELPRVALTQCAASEKKSVADIEAGDLVLW